MKKTLLLGAILICLTGCVNIDNSTYETIASETTNSNLKIYNTYRKGYKFYLPIGLYVENSDDYNETIKSDREKFYMYIDVISYLEKSTTEYAPSDTAEYSKYIQNADKTGYIEIKKLENKKYLVEIAYNYAKIEVIVERTRIKRCLSDALIILSSISYNDTFLKSLDEESLLNYKEEAVDIFDKVGGTDSSNLLEWVEEYDTSGDTSNRPPDYDVIN
ncbi:MAG TPA: hypothetical protein DCY94_01810 [Firmicutes bacterium]|nr:hypothetical protein [Bacillota bacterium]